MVSASKQKRKCSPGPVVEVCTYVGLGMRVTQMCTLGKINTQEAHTADIMDRQCNSSTVR